MPGEQAARLEPLLRAKTRGVLVDGDDTVWYDGRYFRRLRAVLFGVALRHCVSEDNVRKALDLERRQRSAGEQGYSQSVLAVARQIGVNQRALDAVELAVRDFLGHPVELLPSALDALRMLEPCHPILFTKGDVQEQQGKVRRTGTQGIWSKIIIVERKTTSELKRVLDEMQVRGPECVVIGNSIQHDIVPAIENRARAIWLNHSENDVGRHGICPPEAYEVESWLPICEAARVCSRMRLQRKSV